MSESTLTRYTILLAAAIAGCGGPYDDDTYGSRPDAPPAMPPPGECRTYGANIGPAGPPTHLYSQPGTIVVQEMNNIDAFWHSGTSAVVYGPDQAQVMNNALSEPDGYIYYDPAFLQSFDQMSFSYAPSQMILAHEFGHQIQFAYNTFHGDTIQDELGADCYSGYFVGWLACSQSLTDSDVMADFNVMCTLGNAGAGIPWWQPGAHGDCAQRTNAFRAGLNAYVAAIPPLNACTL